MSIRWGDKSNSKSENVSPPAPTVPGSDIEQNLRDGASTTAQETPRFMPDIRQRSGTPSIISQTSTFDGTISGDSDLTIYGKCTGDIVLPHNSLTAGPTSQIKANILAEKVQIEGELTGDVFAKEIKILKTGVVTSNIVSPRVCIEDGAKIKGSVDMDEQLILEKFEKFNVKSTESHSKLMAFDMKNAKKFEHTIEKKIESDGTA